MAQSIILLILLALLGAINPVSSSELEKTYTPLSSGSYLQDKNFYLLTLMQELRGVKLVLESDSLLAAMTLEKDTRLNRSEELCAENIECHAQTFTFSNDEISSIGDRLVALVGENKVLRDLVDNHIRASGNYQRFSGMDDEQALREAWTEAASAINNIIAVYALGEKPRYEKIDSLRYDPSQKVHQQLISASTQLIAENSNAYRLYFEPSLAFALRLLKNNNRDDLDKLAPLMEHENRLTLKRLNNIIWDNYTYSLLLIPGRGPDLEQVSLDPFGKIRLELAAKRYREGLAPLIVVSGGNVHPAHTPYNEAMEMKQALIQVHQIPEDAILIDPMARHTPTNFRNTARIVFRSSIPANKKALFTTTYDQSQDIDMKAFSLRCEEELGYVPYVLKDRISRVDLEFVPRIEALHLNPMDPMDP